MSDKTHKLGDSLEKINNELATHSKALEILPDLVTAIHINNTLLRELIGLIQGGAVTPAEPLNGAALERIRHAATGQ